MGRPATKRLRKRVTPCGDYRTQSQRNRDMAVACLDHARLLSRKATLVSVARATARQDGVPYWKKLSRNYVKLAREHRTEVLPQDVAPCPDCGGDGIQTPGGDLARAERCTACSGGGAA